MTAHAILVQLVILGLSMAVLTEFLYLLTGKAQFQKAGGWLLWGGALLAVLAVITGNLAREVVTIPVAAESLVETHRTAGMLTMSIFLAVAALRLALLKWGGFPKPLKWVYYLLLVVAALFLFRTGTLGASMVNEHGVGQKASEKAPLKKPLFEEE